MANIVISATVSTWDIQTNDKPEVFDNVKELSIAREHITMITHPMIGVLLVEVWLDDGNHFQLLPADIDEVDGDTDITDCTKLYNALLTIWP